MHSQTTIAAIATPPGRGGVGVIRLSGPKAYDIAQKLTQKNLPEARMAGFRKFYDADGGIMDEGIVLCFPNPHYLAVYLSLGQLLQKLGNSPCELLKMAKWTWYKLKQLPI